MAEWGRPASSGSTRSRERRRGRPAAPAGHEDCRAAGAIGSHGGAIEGRKQGVRAANAYKRSGVTVEQCKAERRHPPSRILVEAPPQLNAVDLQDHLALLHILAGKFVHGCDEEACRPQQAAQLCSVSTLRTWHMEGCQFPRHGLATDHLCPPRLRLGTQAQPELPLRYALSERSFGRRLHRHGTPSRGRMREPKIQASSALGGGTSVDYQLAAGKFFTRLPSPPRILGAHTDLIAKTVS